MAGMNKIALSAYIFTGIVASTTLAQGQSTPASSSIQLGPRPFYLVDDMDDSPLKSKLQNCVADLKLTRSLFSIAHRGAPLQFPEHSKEGYQAAARMGAGRIECDVTFTKDKELVCRHSQCDLATTTDILARPELAAKCSRPFSPGAGAKCCTTDITLAEYMTLNAKMDASNKSASTAADFMDATAKWRTDLYATKATVVTHKQSIALIGKSGAKFIPELKIPEVEMPYGGTFTQADFIEKLVGEYKSAGVTAKDVYIQSFNLDDVLYLIKNHPDFGKQAIWLDGRFSSPGFNPGDPQSLEPSMEQLAKQGVRIIAPPMWVLVTTDNGKVVPSAYAIAAKKAGLEIVTWTLERSGPLKNGGGWYYKTAGGTINNDGDMLVMLDVLAKDVGVKGVFSDWPATTTLYASCTGL